MGEYVRLQTLDDNPYVRLAVMRGLVGQRGPTEASLAVERACPRIHAAAVAIAFELLLLLLIT